MSYDTNHEPIIKKVKTSLVPNEDGSNGVLQQNKEHTENHSIKGEVLPMSIYSGSYKKDIIMEDDEDQNISTNQDNFDIDGHLFPFPTDDDVTDMLEDVQYTGAFPTITKRYFTAYYKLNVQTYADDICILLHSNRICMLSLAPSHAVLQEGKQITKVDFKVSDKLDRAMNKVSGKSKHGAQPLQANSKICVIHCANGESYTIKCCMNGKLVEVNEKLVNNPECLLQPPHRGGYLAIILPNIKLLEKMKEDLLTQEQYNLAILNRSDSSTKEVSDSQNVVK